MVRTRLADMPELLADADVATALSELNGWSGDTSAITMTVKLPTFLTAIAVVDQVAQVAEAMDHHPDIDIRWRSLTFLCATHSAGGVTTNDIMLAHRIDEIVATAA